MDTGRLRAVVASLEVPEGESHRIWAIVRRVVMEPAWTGPLRVMDGADGQAEAREWIYELLITSALMRVGHRFARVPRKTYEWRVLPMVEQARRAWKTMGRAELLASLWEIVQAKRWLPGVADEGWEAAMWQQAFAAQTAEGAIRGMGPGEVLDTWVYEELVALHFAFNVAWELGDAAKLEQVRRAVRYHVENTQPDTATTEPWGVGAFLALDETGTFAEQQMHDAMTQMGRLGAASVGRRVMATVLVDALATLELGRA